MHGIIMEKIDLSQYVVQEKDLYIFYFWLII